MIEQATGIVMALLKVAPDQACAYLRRVSSTENRKIADLADEIVRTRRMPSEG